MARDGDNNSVAKYLDEIDAADDELLSLKSDYMNSCKRPRGKIRDTMAMAKEDGVNMTAFRTIVAAHRAERKIEAKLAELEADDQADYEAMKEALGGFGDTELGAAALSKAKRRREGGAEPTPIDDLH